MPLSPPVERTLHHTRRIECTAHERTDGLWDVEGHMTDAKTYSYVRPNGQTTPGQPLHDMWVRLTLDPSLTIRAIEVDMDAFPHDHCPGARPVMQELVGLQIGRGWMGEVKRRTGGALGCTHLRELLGPVATTAIQAIRPALRLRGAPGPGRPPKGSCYGWSDDEDRVKFRARIALAAMPAGGSSDSEA